MTDDVRYRPATEADLPACETIWRDALNDYLVPLGQYEVPEDNPGLRSLHAHALATDPERFWVAVRGDSRGGDEEVVAFGSAVRRASVWFLSMLFVRPGVQAAGLGRSILERIMPGGDEGAGDGPALATVTDAAQPISNGLYASVGIVPRLPMFNLVGRPSRDGILPALPAGVHPVRMDATAPAERDRLFAAEIAALDREVLGYAHPVDHELLRTMARVGFAYRDARGDLLGYGYTSEVGRVGPVAVRDAALHAPVVTHLLEAVLPRGASAIWVPGAAATTIPLLVRAGLRIEGFPVLLCWSRPFADFSRYLPISPGLL